jgi:hypothetical protein
MTDICRNVSHFDLNKLPNAATLFVAICDSAIIYQVICRRRCGYRPIPEFLAVFYLSAFVEIIEKMGKINTHPLTTVSSQRLPAYQAAWLIRIQAALRARARAT